MEYKIKYLPIRDQYEGREIVNQFRRLYGDDEANKIKIINEIRFNVPIYNFGTDEIVDYVPETNEWYLELP